MKAVLLATVVVVVLVVAPDASASRTAAPWAAYLAPAAACPDSGNAAASSAAQLRAMTCLINWTRRQIGVRPLIWSRRLAGAAETKARVVVECGDFSHYPCGTRWPAAAAIGPRRWDVWGENLYVGNLWLRSPRAAMLAWLESPEHRAVLFGRAWRNLGVSVLRAPSLIGASGVSLWVLEVAGRS